MGEARDGTLRERTVNIAGVMLLVTLLAAFAGFLYAFANPGPCASAAFSSPARNVAVPRPSWTPASGPPVHLRPRGLAAVDRAVAPSLQPNINPGNIGLLYRSNGTFAGWVGRTGSQPPNIRIQPAPAAYAPVIAENGTRYGEYSSITGRAKTVYVNGYHRRDGTYVRSHWRSPPSSTRSRGR